MISTCLIGRVKKTQSTPQEEVLSLRKEAGVVQSPPNLGLASYPTGLRERLQMERKMASEWSEKLIMRRWTDGKLMVSGNTHTIWN